MKLTKFSKLWASTVVLGVVSHLSASRASAATLEHEYPFDTGANDIVAGADGTLEGGATLSGDGAVILDGTNGYINLPNDLVSSYTSATLEAWVTNSGSDNWARIYDFGNATAGEDYPVGTSSQGTTYLFLTPRGSGGDMRGSYATNGNIGEQIASAGAAMVSNELTHVIWTSDAGTHTAKIYVNGLQVGVNHNVTLTPADLGPSENDWLGRSQYSSDAFFNGAIVEFRIYDGALNPLEVAASYESGSDFPSFDPGTVQSLDLHVNEVMPQWTDQQAKVLASASFLFMLNNIDVADVPGIIYQSSDEGVLTIDSRGQIQAIGQGTSTVTVEYGGQMDSKTITVVPDDQATLKHRYRFAETSGTTIADSQGSADGTLLNETNASFSGTGQLHLGGGAPGAYVDLPNGIISALTNATFEAWVTYSNTPMWARVFSFGVSDLGDGNAGVGSNYIFLATANPVRYTFKAGGASENPVLDYPGPFPQDVPTHVVCTYNTDVGIAKLFLNGELVATGVATVPLSTLNDLNNWLGRSQFANDPFFLGSFDEFRIYEGSMSDGDVALSYTAGPDTVPATGTGNEVALTLDLNADMTDSQQARVLLDYENVSGVDISVDPDVTFETSDATVATVSASGQVIGHANGTATITANYHGLTDSREVTVLVGGPPMVHRYPFNETSGTMAQDVIGGADGNLLGGANFTGTGEVNLNGSSAYVDLPNGIISSLNDATFELWVTWRGGNNWQRIFDFGSSVQGEGNSGQGMTYFLVSPSASSGKLRCTISTNSNVAGAETYMEAPTALPTDVISHLVITFNFSARTMSMFLNGARVASTAITVPLRSLDDVNNWLGRSQYNDPYLDGLIHGFRIYDRVLSAAEIAASGNNGLNVPAIDPGAITDLRLNVTNPTLAAGNPVPAMVEADFANVNNIDVTMGQGVVYTSSDTAVATVNGQGVIHPLAAGSATITADFMGLSDSVALTVNAAPMLITAGDLLVDLTPESISADGTTWMNQGTVAGDFAREGGTAKLINDVNGTGVPGVLFDGFDAFRGPLAPAGITGAGDRSFEVWVLNPAIAGEEPLLSIAKRGTTARNCSFNYGNNTVYGAAGQWGGGYDVGWNDAANVPVANAWHHIVYTYDGATTCRIYVDGALRVTKALDGALNTWPDLPMLIGAELEGNGVNFNTGLYLTAYINSVRVHDGMLSDADVANNYAAGPALIPQGPVEIGLSPRNTLVGEGAPAALQATAYGAEPISYQWYANEMPIPDSNASDYLLGGASLADGGDYYVVASNYFNGTAYTATSSVATLSVVSSAYALTHRYSFNTDAGDSVGGADGTLMGAASLSGGEVVLDGTSGTFVDLPNDLVSDYPAITMEAWFTDNGSGNWARLWDFGSTVQGEGNSGTGYKYMFFAVNGGPYRSAYKIYGPEQVVNYSPAAVGEQRHVVWTSDAASHRGTLYVNGVPVSVNFNLTYSPAAIGSAFNDWLGRSQFNDPYMLGSINEFRIYNAVLSDAQVAASYAAGPDAELRPALSIVQSGSDVILSWPTTGAGFSVESSPVLGPDAVWSSAGTPTLVGDYFELTVPLTSMAQYFRLVK